MTLSRAPCSSISIRGLTLTIIAGVAFLEPMLAHAQATGPTVEQLQKEIQERDAVIRDLLHRVAKLEQPVPRVDRSETEAQMRPHFANSCPVATLRPIQAAIVDRSFPPIHGEIL